MNIIVTIVRLFTTIVATQKNISSDDIRYGWHVTTTKKFYMLVFYLVYEINGMANVLLFEKLVRKAAKKYKNKTKTTAKQTIISNNEKRLYGLIWMLACLKCYHITLVIRP